MGVAAEKTLIPHGTGAQASHAAHARKPLRTIRPTGGAGFWSPRGLAAALDLREMWAFRDLFGTLASRDVKLRYRQTILGVVWVALQPLLAALIFTFVFNKMAGLTATGAPYFVFAFAGQLAWGAYSQTLTKSANSLVGNTGLVSKVYFPRLILPLSTVLSTFIDFAVGFALLAVLMVAFHAFPGWPLLTLPLWLFLITLLAVGAGLIAGALMVSYRDVAYVLPVALNLLLFGSPIGWGLEKIPLHLRTAYLLANPFAPLLSAFRWSLLAHGVRDPHAAPVPWAFVAYGALFAVTLFIVGALTFRRMERRFADVI